MWNRETGEVLESGAVILNKLLGKAKAHEKAPKQAYQESNNIFILSQCSLMRHL